MRDGRPAIQLVLERIPATLALTLPAFFFKVALGIPVGGETRIPPSPLGG